MGSKLMPCQRRCQGQVLAHYINCIVYVVSYAALGFFMGFETCHFDFLGVVTNFFNFCEISFAISGIYTTIVCLVYSVEHLLLFTFLQAFGRRFAILKQIISDLSQYGTESSLKAVIDVLEDLIETLRCVIDAHTPQLLIRFCASYMSALASIYYAHESYLICHYEIVFFMVLFAMVDLVGTFLLTNDCQIIIDGGLALDKILHRNEEIPRVWQPTTVKKVKAFEL